MGFFKQGYPAKYTYRYRVSNNNLINQDGILRFLYALLLISFLLIGAFIIIPPASAIDAPNTEQWGDSNFIQNNWVPTVVNDQHLSHWEMDYFTLQKSSFWKDNTLASLKYWTATSNSLFLQLPSTNTSTTSNIIIQNASMYEIGRATLVWSVSSTPSNTIYIGLFFNSWNGDKLIAGNSLESLYLNWSECIGSSEMLYTHQYYQYITGTTSSPPAYSEQGVGWGSVNSYAPAYSFTVEYTNSVSLLYFRIPAYPYDFFNIYRLTGNSNIDLSHYQNGSWITDISGEGINDLTHISVINGSMQKLTFTNPVTSRAITYNWNGIPLNPMFLNLNKSFLQVNEPAHAIGGFINPTHDEPNIIIWVDSQGDPILHTDKPIAYFKKEGPQWQKYYNGEYINVSTPYEIDDSFTIPYNQHYIYISAYQDNILIGTAIAYINVAGGEIKQLLTIIVQDSDSSALLSNSNISIQDITSNTFVKNDTTLSGIYTYFLNINRLYLITATHENYIPQTKSITFINASTITFPLERQSNISITQALLKFKVFSDSTFNFPISNALIRLQTGETKLTNSAGYAEFNLSCSLIVNYQISKEGYTSYGNTFDTSLICGSQYTVMVWLQSGEPSPTPEIGECEGVSVNPITNIKCIFRSFEIEPSLDSGILGIGLVILLAGLFLYIARNSDSAGMAALIGGAIGFIFATFLGLFPIWILIAMAIVFGIIYAQRESGG